MTQKPTTNALTVAKQETFTDNVPIATAKNKPWNDIQSSKSYIEDSPLTMQYSWTDNKHLFSGISMSGSWSGSILQGIQQIALSHGTKLTPNQLVFGSQGSNRLRPGPLFPREWVTNDAWPLYVGEVIIFNRKLSITEDKLMRGYLLKKLKFSNVKIARGTITESSLNGLTQSDLNYIDNWARKLVYTPEYNGGRHIDYFCF